MDAGQGGFLGSVGREKTGAKKREGTAVSRRALSKE